MDTKSPIYKGSAYKDLIHSTLVGVEFDVWVSPGASANKIMGPHALENGQMALKVAVSAPPEKGKANKAVIKLLASSLGFAKTALSITKGEASRHKTLVIDGNIEKIEATLKESLHPWLP